MSHAVLPGAPVSPPRLILHASERLEELERLAGIAATCRGLRRRSRPPIGPRGGKEKEREERRGGANGPRVGGRVCFFFFLPINIFFVFILLSPPAAGGWLDQVEVGVAYGTRGGKAGRVATRQNPAPSRQTHHLWPPWGVTAQTQTLETVQSCAPKSVSSVSGGKHKPSRGGGGVSRRGLWRLINHTE